LKILKGAFHLAVVKLIAAIQLIFLDELNGDDDDELNNIR
jgi:hypothetical protein